MFLEIIATCLILLLFWFLPAFIISLAVKRTLKKKISKGWCILIFFISSLLSFTILALLNAHWESFGTIWKFLALVIVWQTVSTMLFDNKIPSIFDTEKDLKMKNNIPED